MISQIDFTQHINITKSIGMNKQGLGYLKQERVLNITVTLTLDTKRKSDELNVCVRVNQNRKTIYIRTGLKVTLKYWDKLIASTGRGVTNESKSLWKVKESQLIEFDRTIKEINKLREQNAFSLDALQKNMKGKSGGESLLALWEEVASSKKLGTAESYRIAAKCFEKLVGDIAFKDVNEETIDLWEKEMEKLYSHTTIGIYMRACRVVVNEAIRRNLVDEKKYPFGKGKIEIKKGSTRKEEYLSVTDMMRLYNFSEQDVPGHWKKGYKFVVLRSVATFLAAYLGNGMNLADLARLEYNDYYFSTGKSCFRFLRTKTKDKSDNQSEVIVPIVPELRAIINKYGSEEKCGNRVFDYVLENIKDEELIRKHVAQENSNIKDRLAVVCKLLEMPQRPSMTWARHSFATNLTHAGVPERYISQAMGHSTSKNVTALYISEFPHEKMMQFNSFLLEEKREDIEMLPKNNIRDELKKMSKNELLSMFVELMNEEV